MRGSALLAWLRSFRLRTGGLSVERLCDILKFDPKAMIKNYSSGNRKKLALIQALQHRPRLLILDEPTTGLDPIIKQNFYSILQSLKRSGTTIFFSSHDLTEVQKVCDRVAIIKDGRIVAVEGVADLIGKSGLVMEVSFAEPPSEARLQGLEVVARNGRSVRLRVRREEINATLEQLNQQTIDNLTVTQPTLEDIFLTWYR
jgi:ABC-2 type transport system ATP-binding protein